MSRSYRFLIAALAASIVIHLLGPLAMIGLLAPGLDMDATAASRAAFVASHPWTWRIGWLAWQLTAASDLAVSIGLVVYAPPPGKPGRGRRVFAVLALLATVAAIVPDQTAEALFVTRFIDEARAVVAGTLSLHDYVKSEARLLLMTGTCATTLYAVMGLGWTGAGAYRRNAIPVIGLGMLCWALFGTCAIVNAKACTQASPAGYPGFGATFVFNAAGFALLFPWMILLGISIGDEERVQHPRSDAALHALEMPAPFGWIGRLAASPGLADMRRVLRLPFPVLESDIANVVYLSWLVPKERVEKLLPAPLRPHLLGDRTAISILTYTHGHFAPRLLGPLRALAPSPRQSNWRFYCEPERPDAPRDAIYFFKTVIDNPLYVLGSRAFADGLPSHSGRMTHLRRDAKSIETTIDPRGGSAPDLVSRVREVEEKKLPASWSAFPSWEEAVKYLVEQNRAVSVLDGRINSSRISIPIAVSSVVPAVVESFESRWLAPLVEGCEVLAFVVPSVEFLALGDELRDA